MPNSEWQWESEQADKWVSSWANGCVLKWMSMHMLCMHTCVCVCFIFWRSSQTFIGLHINITSMNITFSFFFWHYSPWRLVYSKIVLHCSWSCRLHLQFLTPMFFRSSSTDSSTLKLGFPIYQVPSGLRRISLLQGYSSCILQRCPSHLNLPIFNTLNCLVHWRASSLKSTINTILS